MSKRIGLVLTQIVTQQQMGFRHFEVIAGLTGPVAVLLYPRTQAWGTWDARIRPY